MGVTPPDLAKLYPRLYHMAEADSWDSISRHGLLSTSSLLDLFGTTGEERKKIELRRRDRSHPLEHPTHGRIVIRDQKPIIESKLSSSLQGCKLEEWYRILNARVFFWLTRERLNTLLSAREYRNKPHTVLTLGTLPLARDYEASITLSPMNSGNTLPIAHPHGPATFKRMRDYPFHERLKRGPYYTVVELAVESGVRNILDYTIRVETILSIAAHAQVVVDPTEAEKALSLLMRKYPPQESIPVAMPAPADVRIFRVTPMVISVLDYSKGFGHTDLVTC